MENHTILKLIGFNQNDFGKVEFVNDKETILVYAYLNKIKNSFTHCKENHIEVHGIGRK